MKENKEGLMAAFEKIIDAHPDWRIGQMITNVALWARGPEVGGIWDMEDAEFVQTVNQHVDKLTSRGEQL